MFLNMFSANPKRFRRLQIQKKTALVGNEVALCTDAQYIEVKTNEWKDKFIYTAMDSRYGSDQFGNR